MDLDKLTNHDDNSFPTLNKEPTQVSDNVGNESNVSNNENATISKRGGKAGRGRGGAKAAGVGRGGGKAGGGKGKGGSTTQSGGDKTTNGGNGTSSTAAASSSITIPAPTFPLARVSRIVKADPDIQTVSKDAIWTIAVATELFIKHLTDSLIAKTKLEKKKIASYDELAAVVESQEEFDFLQEVIPEPIQAQEAFAMRKELQEQNYQRAVGLLIDEDSDEEEEEEEEGGEEEAAGDEAAVAEEVQSTEQQQQDESQPKEKKKSTKGKKANPDVVASNSAVEDVGDTSTVSKKGGKGGRKSTSKVAEPNDGDEIMQDV